MEINKISGPNLNNKKCVQSAEIKKEIPVSAQNVDSKSPVSPSFYSTYNNISFKGRGVDNTNFRTDLENRAEISTAQFKTYGNMKMEKRFGVWDWADNGTDEELKLYKTKHHEYVQSADGSKIYKVKYVEDKDRISQLVLASKLYQSAGVRTPEYIPFESDGKTGYLVEVIEEKLEPQETNKDAIYYSFVADAWLGNRNGLSRGNTLIDKDGNPVKMSVSGALGYRACGKPKDSQFSAKSVEELKTMRDYSKNSDAAKALASMSDDDLFKAIEKFKTNYNRSKILDIVGWAFEVKNQYQPQNCDDTLCHIIESRCYKVTDSITETKNEIRKRRLQERGFFDGKTSAQATNMGQVTDLEHISEISEEGWQRLKDRNLLQKRYGLKKLTAWDYTYLAQMTDEEHTRALKRNLYAPYRDEATKWYRDIGGIEIKGLSELSDDEWDIVKTRRLMDLNYDHHIKGFLSEFIEYAINIEPSDWYSLLSTNYLDKYVSIDDVKSYIKLRNDENLKKELEPSFDARMKLLCRLEDKNISYFDRKWSPEYLCNFAIIQNDKWKRLEGLTNNFTDSSLSPNTLAELCNFDDETFEILKKRGFAQNATGSYGLDKIAALTDEEWENVQKRNLNELLPNDYNSWSYLAMLDDEEFQIAHDKHLFDKRSEKGMHNEFDGEEIAKLVTSLTPEDWKNFEKRGLLNDYRAFNGWGWGHPGAYLSIVLSKYSDREFEKYNKITNGTGYIYPDTVIELVKLPDEACQRIFDRNLYQYMNQYEAYDNWTADASVIGGLAQLDDKDYKNFLEQKNDCNTIAAKILITKAERLGLDKKHSITELNIKEKKEYLKLLITQGGVITSKDFRNNFRAKEIVPKDINEYTEIMKKLIKSTGVYQKTLDSKTKAEFYSAIDKIIAPNSEFSKLDLKGYNFSLNLKYDRQKFMSDVENLVDGLDESEKLKVWDYFGFEVTGTPKVSRTMFGYPALVNNDEKLKEIENPQTKSVIEKLKPFVQRFTEENEIVPDGINVSDSMAKTLNAVFKAMPELYTIVGKEQHGTHDYSVDIHTLAVLQECINNPEFKILTDDEKRTMVFTALLHDITKEEKSIDKSHPENSSYDAYFLLSKFNLSKTQQLDIYQMIKNHDMLEKCNKGPYNKLTGRYDPISEDDRTKKIQRYAYEFRSGHLADMAKIFTKADLLSVKKDGSFFELYRNAFDNITQKLKKEVKNIQKTSILLPQTRIPNAKDIKTDGINVVLTTTYDEEGNAIKNKVIKMSKDLDLSQYGFDNCVNGSNFNVLVHGFDEEYQGVVLDALELTKQDALLSSSYVIYDKGNYHVFRPYGFIKDVPCDSIGAAYYRDFGSGCKKTEQELIDSYLNGGNNMYRTYISMLIKKELDLDDDEYIKLYYELKDKPMEVIERENPKAASALKRIFSNMEIHKRRFNRNYNEVLIGGCSGSGRVSGVFFQGCKPDGTPYKIEDVPAYLRKYAQNNDLPIIYFGK